MSAKKRSGYAKSDTSLPSLNDQKSPKTKHCKKLTGLMYHYVRPVNYKSTLSKLLYTLKTKTVIFLPK